MMLSKLLGKIAQDTNLVADEVFCDLVQAAWEDFNNLFHILYENDRDNFLYGRKRDVEGVWNNTIRLLTPKGKDVWGVKHTKECSWKELAEMVECTERCILAQAKYNRRALTSGNRQEKMEWYRLTQEEYNL
jgi:hypothetical protein